MATKRKNGWYQTSVVIGRNRDGSYKRKYIYAKTKWELDDRRAELEHNLKYGLSADADKATFDEIAQEWLKHKRFFVDDSRFYRYEAVLRNHLCSIARVQVIKLKTIHIQNILDEKAADGYSKKVLAEIKQTAKQVLDYAMQYDIVMRNVAYLAKVPKNAPEGHRNPLTEEQIRLVLNHWQGNRMGVPALIMLYCGLRKGEMIALQWSHVNLRDKTIFIEKSASSTKNRPKVKGPKTKAGVRTVPIPDFLADILRDSARRKESMFVCPAAGGTMMTEQAWKNAWDSYMHHLNICAGGRVGSRSRPKVVAMERFTAHQLRHTYATMLYNANVDVKSAQEYLGHSSIQTTLAVYTHLTPEKREASTKAFNDYLTQNRKTPILSNG